MIIINILINGLVYGTTYALMAVGFSLVFGVAKILTLAHTGFYMIAGFLIFIAVKVFNLSLLPSAVLAVLITGVLGIISYKLCLDRIKEHQTAVLIVSVGLVMLFQEVLLLIFGGDFKGIPPFIVGFVNVGDIKVTDQSFLIIIVSIAALLGLWVMLSKTNLGISIRAVAEDMEVANLMGINVGRVSMIIVGISAVLAGISGVVAAPIFMVHPLMWLHPLVIVLAAVVLGGLGSVKGSVIASFIMGYAETSVIYLVPGGAFLGGAVSLCVMVIILLIRPEGLFGIAFEEERL